MSKRPVKKPPSLVSYLRNQKFTNFMFVFVSVNTVFMGAWIAVQLYKGTDLKKPMRQSQEEFVMFFRKPVDVSEKRQKEIEEYRKAWPHLSHGGK